MIRLIMLVMLYTKNMGVVYRGGCYRIGGRHVEGFEIILSFVLYFETFSFTHTGL